ncbi:MAG: LytR/AlgR family response regulator transcription factor [Bacteroidota bacterium]
MINCALIDDDKVFLQVMKHYFNKIDFLHLSCEFSLPDVALNSIDFSKINVLFLDMEMPKINGIRFLSSLSFVPPVVIISKKKEYATEAFDYNALDYLHKPVSFQRFLKTAHKIKDHFDSQVKKNNIPLGHMFIRVDGYWLRMDLSEIQIIKADNNNVFVKKAERDYRCSQRFREFIDQLPAEHFMQVHRSYIINLGHINKVDGEIIQVGNRIVPVSKTYVEELYRRLNISR